MDRLGLGGGRKPEDRIGEGDSLHKQGMQRTVRTLAAKQA